MMIPDVNPQLILASTSAYRRTLLEKLGLPFLTVAPAVDETPLADETPDALVRRLALSKAEAVAQRTGKGLVIGSDQVATLDGQIIGKPGTRSAAIAQLRLASGKTVAFHTALTVIQAETGIACSALDLCRVSFRELTLAEIERYVDREQPLDCAGSFKSEGLGIALLSRIEGDDPNALIGLPLIQLTGILSRFGVTVV